MRLEVAIVLVAAAVPIADRLSADPGFASDSAWHRVVVALFWAGVVGASALAVDIALDFT